MKFDCRGYSLPIGEKTIVMGILNITPDSFSDGGNWLTVESALRHAKEMVADGADIIDVGGESTRPGACPVDAEEELRRVIPVISALVNEIDVPISIDSYKAETVEAALNAGVHMVNDIWGLQCDHDMAKIIHKYGVPVVLMHNSIDGSYSDIVSDIKRFLSKSVSIAVDHGISEDQIIVDPGIGFGKNSDENVTVLARLGELRDLGLPILIGTSRKAFIGRILDLPPGERVEGTIATAVLGAAAGADIVRVHDVKQVSRALKVADAILDRV